MTPMMQQYLAVKEEYKDSILLYRLGDFYEMFFEDAKTASRELELTLTGRDCGEPERAPMCGVPYHAAETYIGRLVNKGYKVVVCEQTEDPAQAKGLVRREVTRIITPGTVIGQNIPSATKNNYLCSICFMKGEIGVAFADISTGDMAATRFEGPECVTQLINELAAYSPTEAILNIRRYDIPDLSIFLDQRLNAFVTDMQGTRFEISRVKGLIDKCFADTELETLRSDALLCSSVGALIDYILETQKTEISYIKEINIYQSGRYLEMDANTRRNLELCETMRSKEKRGSLLGVLDKTYTSAGARMLRKWIDQPLVNTNQILRRQSAVDELYSDMMLRDELAELLRGVLDLERLMSKIVYGSANSRDLKSVSATISIIPQIKNLLCNAKSTEINSIYNTLDTLDDIYGLIERAIVEKDQPFSVREGGMIREGYNAEVDRLNAIKNGGQGYIRDIEVREREATGIPKLKVGYNRVFGYYIEISKSYTDMAPENYMRKQTLTNCERYITEELKKLESEVLGASDKLAALEYQLFMEICTEISKTENVKRIQGTAAALATLDTYLSLGTVAAQNNYVRPEVDYSDVITVKEGRHPVVEKFTRDGVFVPNDTLLDTAHNRMILITGPNMAGKSTFMRQVALITLMAQIGSFVPAEEARVGIVDKIFTRVGASDDLASGQSTFMLEMNEVAYILKNATKRSLIIYDEIGRGTSTYDGMSIARAVVEYTASKKIGAKTLFATHYHELTSLEGEVEGVRNYNIAAKKRGDDIIFLRKIVKGATDESYGIEVAKLAGVPNPIIKRAKEVLGNIETETRRIPIAAAEDDEGMNLTFEDFARDEAIHKLKNTDLNILTPLDALNLIADIKKILG